MRSTTAAADGSLLEKVKAGQLPPPIVRRGIRRDARLSLREVAEELGVAPMTVLRWEQGKSEPRLRHAIRYRELLDGLKRAVR